MIAFCAVINDDADKLCVSFVRGGSAIARIYGEVMIPLLASACACLPNHAHSNVCRLMVDSLYYVWSEIYSC